MVSTNVYKLWITRDFFASTTQVGTASTGIMDSSTSGKSMHGRIVGFRWSQAYVDDVASVVQVVAVGV